MKHIKNYEKFNEEISNKALRNLATAGIITLGAAGLYNTVKNNGTGDFVKEVKLGNIKFKEYDVITNYTHFDMIISDDGAISSHHSYSETEGSGEDSRTETINIYLLNLPNNSTHFYYNKSLFSVPKASLNEFPESKKIELKDLNVYFEKDNYIVYSGGFFGTFDYIIINKGILSDGEDFTIDNLATYKSIRYSKDIYVFGIGKLKGGRFSGGGSGSDF